MPTFNDVEVTTRVDIDFEVYCGTCGAGLCSESDTRMSRSRNYAQVTVNACPNCMSKKDKEIKDLLYELEELRESINLKSLNE